MNLSELRLRAAEKRAQAASARELADRLSEQEERQEILRYADDLDRDASKLDAQIAATGSTNAFDAIQKPAE